MYQIKRNHVVEDLQVEDNGKTLDLHVDLNVDGIMQRYLTAAKTFADAQKAVRSSQTEERITAYGDAILGLFDVIFGEDQTKQLVEFYDGAYTEMLTDVMPFIYDVVAPKVTEAQQRVMQQYQNIKRFKR